MAIAKDMFVFASAIDEDGLSVEIEAVVAFFSQDRPRDAANAKRRAYFIGGFAFALNHRRKVIKIRLFKAPTMGILYTFCMTDSPCLASL